MMANVVETATLLFTTRMLEWCDMLAVLPVSLPCHMDDFGIITRSDQLMSPSAQRVTAMLREMARAKWMTPVAANVQDRLQAQAHRRK